MITGVRVSEDGVTLHAALQAAAAKPGDAGFVISQQSPTPSKKLFGKIGSKASPHRRSVPDRHVNPERDTHAGKMKAEASNGVLIGFVAIKKD